MIEYEYEYAFIGGVIKQVLNNCSLGFEKGTLEFNGPNGEMKLEFTTIIINDIETVELKIFDQGEIMYWRVTTIDVAMYTYNVWVGEGVCNG